VTEDLHQELIHEVRHRVYGLFLKYANERKEEYLCPHQTYSAIDEIISHCQDNVYVDIDIIEYAKYEETSPKMLDWYINMSKTSCIGYPFKKIAFHKIRDAYLLYYNLEAIMTEIKEEMSKGMYSMKSRCCGTNPVHDPYAYAVEEVMVELDNDFEYVCNLVEEIHSKYKTIVEWTQTQLAGFMMLRERSKVAAEMRDKGAFTHQEWSNIESETGHLFRKIHEDFPANFQFGEKTSNVALDFPLLRSLNESQRLRMREIFDSTEKTYQQGKIVIQKDHSHFETLLFIHSGFLEETWGGLSSRKRGAGYICGKANVCIETHPRWYTTYSTYPDVPCVVSEVPKDVFMKFMQENREFEEDIFQSSFADFVHIMDDPMDFNPCYHLPERAVLQISQHAKYCKLQAGERLAMPYGGFLPEGLLKRVPLENSNHAGMQHQFDYKYKPFCFILPNYCKVEALELSDVIVFESPVFAHSFEQSAGDIVEMDVTHLLKAEGHKDKYVRGADAFATHDIGVPLGTCDNSKQYMKLAKDALIGDEYACDAVNLIENAGFHNETNDETEKLRKFDAATSSYMHRTMWGEDADQKGLGNRKSIANYDNLRRLQNSDVVEKMNYKKSNLDHAVKKHSEQEIMHEEPKEYAKEQPAQDVHYSQTPAVPKFSLKNIEIPTWANVQRGTGQVGD
jgi:hypothetical protein